MAYILKEIHESECRNHSGGRSLCKKTKRQGYYWPTMLSDSDDVIKWCDKCQRHSPMFHQPAKRLSSIKSPYPFMKYSMDIVGPLPRANDQCKYLLILTDYFTKWVEAEAYAEIKDSDVESFIWRNIICRFGVPQETVIDNRFQLISGRFNKFCRGWKIDLSFSTLRYPQGNEQNDCPEPKEKARS